MIYLQKDAIQVDEAAKYTAEEVEEAIQKILSENQGNEGLMSRTLKSYLREWAVHALCSRWGIMKEKAKNAHLQFDMEPEVKFMYNVLGPIALCILKLYR